MKYAFSTQNMTVCYLARYFYYLYKFQFNFNSILETNVFIESVIRLDIFSTYSNTNAFDACLCATDENQ